MQYSNILAVLESTYEIRLVGFYRIQYHYEFFDLAMHISSFLYRLDIVLSRRIGIPFKMEYYLSQNNMTGQVAEAGYLPSSEEDNLYIAFSPKNKELSQRYADILTKETAEMRRNGELAAILETYGLTDWEK